MVNKWFLAWKLPLKIIFLHTPFILIIYIRIFIIPSSASLKLCIMQILLCSIKHKQTGVTGDVAPELNLSKIASLSACTFPSPRTTAVHRSTEAIYNKNRLEQIQWNPTSKFRESGELEWKVSGWFDRHGLLLLSAQALENKIRLPVYLVDLIREKVISLLIH